MGIKIGILSTQRLLQISTTGKKCRDQLTGAVVTHNYYIESTSPTHLMFKGDHRRRQKDCQELENQAIYCKIVSKKKGVQVVRRDRGWPRGGGGRSGKNMRKNGREND